MFWMIDDSIETLYKSAVKRKLSINLVNEYEP